MTTNERLAAIKARAEAATEGPWWTYGGELQGPHEPIFQGDTWGGGASASDSDAEFIARARTDVPQLVAALEAVLTQTTAMREAAATGYSDRTTRLILESWADEIEAVINEALGVDQP